MLSTRLLLTVACAALLQDGYGAEERSAHRNRYRDSTQIALGRFTGENVITLPTIILDVGSGTSVVAFPDNCAQKGKRLLGTHVIATSKYGGSPPELNAVDADDPRSQVKVHCDFMGHVGTGCPGGVVVSSYQFCAPMSLTMAATP